MPVHVCMVYTERSRGDISFALYQPCNNQTALKYITAVKIENTIKRLQSLIQNSMQQERDETVRIAPYKISQLINTFVLHSVKPMMSSETHKRAP